MAVGLDIWSLRRWLWVGSFLFVGLKKRVSIFISQYTALCYEIIWWFIDRIPDATVPAAKSSDNKYSQCGYRWDRLRCDVSYDPVPRDQWGRCPYGIYERVVMVYCHLYLWRVQYYGVGAVVEWWTFEGQWLFAYVGQVLGSLVIWVHATPFFIPYCPLIVCSLDTLGTQ